MLSRSRSVLVTVLRSIAISDSARRMRCRHSSWMALYSFDHSKSRSVFSVKGDIVGGGSAGVGGGAKLVLANAGESGEPNASSSYFGSSLGGWADDARGNEGSFSLSFLLKSMGLKIRGTQLLGSKTNFLESAVWCRREDERPSDPADREARASLRFAATVNCGREAARAELRV